jgi:hypothetical protein
LTGRRETLKRGISGPETLVLLYERLELGQPLADLILLLL